MEGVAVEAFESFVALTMGASRNRLVLATVKSFFGSRGVEPARDGQLPDQAVQLAVRADQRSGARNAVIDGASPRYGYPIDQIELWLYVGKFAAGKTGEHERRIREWAAMQIVGAGPIRAFGLQDIVATARRVASTLRAELLDRTLIWNHTHLRHALREYERHYDEHRTHRSLAAAAPLRDRPQHLRPGQIEHLNVERQDRLGGVIHEYRHAAEPARV